MFETHKLNDAGFEAVRKFKGNLVTAVNEALTLLPEGREKSIFLTKMEEAVFFGTKSLAALPENHSEVIGYTDTDSTIINNVQ